MRLTIAASLLFGTLSAQPVLTSEQMLAPGNATYMRFYNNFSPVDTTLQGADVDWDFTDLVPSPGNSEFIATIVDPATTPHANMFATDNYAYHEAPNGYYRFFQKTPTFMQRVGSWTGSPYVMADPQVEYVFPMTMGTSNMDTWWGVADGGTYGFECVGWGTLSLPGAELEDVLMLRLRIENQTFVARAYAWYSGTDGRILLQYINEPSLGLFSGLYYDGFAMDVHEQRPLRATVLGNPVTDVLNLVLDQQSGALDYDLLSISGTTLGRGRFAGDAGRVQHVGTADLAPGIYLLRLTEAGLRPTTLRFIKQ